jgi:hypothetical protein
MTDDPAFAGLVGYMELDLAAVLIGGADLDLRLLWRNKTLLTFVRDLLSFTNF